LQITIANPEIRQIFGRSLEYSIGPLAAFCAPAMNGSPDGFSDIILNLNYRRTNEI